MNAPVALIARAGGPATGVGRYVVELQRALRAAGSVMADVVTPMPPLPYRLLRRVGLDAQAFFATYPIRAHYPHAAIYHFSSQNLASLLVVRPPRGPTVVTVHDIIPYVLGSYRTRTERWFDQLAMAGVQRAHWLVADSAATRDALVQHLGIAPVRIRVVPLGIDHQRFRPLHDAEARARLGLRPDQRTILYVGSEDPRKNLAMLIDALARVRQHHDVVLLKVGRAHHLAVRAQLVAQIAALGLTDAVRFLEDVADDVLPAIYTLADLSVMPSLHEGFGFPLLESMACGTSVVYSAASSLPELAGDAGLAIAPGPDMAQATAAAITRLLDEPQLAAAQREAGIARAAHFTWRRTALMMQEIYAMAQHTNAGGS